MAFCGRNSRIDWTLIEVRSGHAARCSNTFTHEEMNPSVFPGGVVTITKFHSEGDLKHHRVAVWKNGGKTGLTEGKFNGTWSRVIFDQEWARPRDRTVSEELVVVAEVGSKFSRGGDSGGWVFGKRGVLYGMVLGGSDTLLCTYVSDANLVRKDIGPAIGKEPSIANFDI